MFKNYIKRRIGQDFWSPTCKRGEITYYSTWIHYMYINQWGQVDNNKKNQDFELRQNLNHFYPKKIVLLCRCLLACVASPNCCSYEYSPVRKMCNLNNECEPKEKKIGDFLFCKKRPKPWNKTLPEGQQIHPIPHICHRHHRLSIPPQF